MQFPHLPPRLHILQVHTRHLAIRHHLVWTFSVLTLWTFSVLTLEFPPSPPSLQSPLQPLSAAWWPLSCHPFPLLSSSKMLSSRSSPLFHHHRHLCDHEKDGVLKWSLVAVSSSFSIILSPHSHTLNSAPACLFFSLSCTSLSGELLRHMLLRFLYRNYPSWLFVDSQSSSNMSDANSGIQPTSSLCSHFTRKTLVPRFGIFVFRILRRRQNPHSSPVSGSDSLALGKLTHLHFLAVPPIFLLETFLKVPLYFHGWF